MNKKELMKKVNANEGLTVEEIIEYQKIVKLEKHVYGKYGNLALEYLKEHNVGKYWALAGSLPEYLHNVDKQADRLYMKMYEKLSNSPKFSKTGEYVHDLQVETEKQRIIEEEILNECLPYGKSLVIFSLIRFPSSTQTKIPNSTSRVPARDSATK